MIDAKKVGEKGGSIVEKAFMVLAEYPLCDRCLGRMFALLGRGLSNAERGRSIKTLLVQSLHSLIREGDEEAVEAFKKIAANIGEPAATLYRELFGKELESRPCYICGSRLDKVIEDAAKDAVAELRRTGIRSFIVAAHVPDYIIRAENEVKLKFGLQYAESIKAEIRREVSKRIQRYGYRPDFDAPDAVINVYYEPYSLLVDVMPLLVLCRYKKLARRVSQSTWLTRDGLKYPYSVELALSPLAELLEGDTVVLHAAGREDADARMLGNGRPCIAEVKHALRREVDFAEASRLVSKASKGLVEIEFFERVTRKKVREIKEDAEKHVKVYKALVVTSKPLDKNSLHSLEEYFRDRVIEQRTPRRVRHRRADIIRRKRVYRVYTRQVAGNVFEALIVADAGLYIKELVDGDGGDTRPSFAEFLGADAYCAELDVVYIIQRLT